VPPDAAEAIAVEGKTLRGSKTQGVPAAPLLSALAPRLGLTRAQQAVADKTNAIPMALERLRHVLLAGRVVMMDALFTPRPIAPQLVDTGGDYVMLDKEHQPQ
jgi:hypothetical protein